MKGIKKIVLLILLLSAIILPQAIQNYHALTVQHHISHCDTQCPSTSHFHKATEHCSIHEFVFKTFSYKGIVPIVPTPFVTGYFAVSYKPQFFKQQKLQSYYLRGPPNTLFI